MPAIDHAALWTPDLERARTFYEKYFGATSGEKYRNPAKDFTSYFLTFDARARLELMHTPSLSSAPDHPAVGYVHVAISVGSEQRVDTL